MSTTVPPAPAPARKPVSSHPTTLALAPYCLAALIIVAVAVLLALGKITESAGIGLLGVIVGGHGAVAVGRIMGGQGGV